MATRLFGCIAALVAAAIAVASGQAPAVQSYRVQGNVWVLVSGTVNAAVQIGDEGVLVVDTMTDALADPMVAEIKKLAGDKPIRWIVNTHAHADHTGGNAKVAAAAVIQLLKGEPVNATPVVMNTCYSFVTARDVIHVASVHQYDAADKTFKTVPGSGGVSQAANQVEGRNALSWAQNIWADMLAT